VKRIASFLLHIIRLMNLNQLRTVNQDEIQDAGRRWLADDGCLTTRQRGNSSLYHFVNTAQDCFRYHKLLATPSVPARRFDQQLASFTHYLKTERQFVPAALEGYRARASSFLSWAGERHESIQAISLSDVDEFLTAQRGTGYKPATMAALALTLRTFFRFSESQGWSDFSIAQGIRSPRVPRPDATPKGPCWRDVRRLIAATKNDSPNELRARAVILLCSIYAIRAIEIGNLTLNDFDWINETFTVKRAKNTRIQRFPIQFEVGEAILDYLRRGRPLCSSRSLFISLTTPYKPINSDVVWGIVTPRMKKLGIQSEKMGSHSLRHACATRLLKKGASLRDIADFLGHCDMSTVSVYAKCDARVLHTVAAFSLAGVK
jgi:site-specific recombinase XerD